MKSFANKINIAVMLLAALSVTAQEKAKEKDELSKAIVVEKDFTPVETKAVKPETTPKALPLNIEKVKLSFSDWAIPAEVNPAVVTQEPVRYADNFKFLRKRGYLSFAMGNYMNIVGSAGFRFIDNERTSFGAWLQHNSTNGDINNNLRGSTVIRDYDKQFVTDDKLSFDFSHRFDAGILSANAAYRYSHFNYYGLPKLTDEKADKQSVHDADVDLLWKNTPSPANNINYYVGAGLGFYGTCFGSWTDWSMTEVPNGELDGMKELHGRFKGGVELMVDDDAFAGIDAGFQLLSQKNTGEYAMSDYLIAYDNFAGSSMSYPLIQLLRPAGTDSRGMLSLTPYYNRRNGNVNLRLGARVDVSFSDGTVFRIAPDVRLDWALNRQVGIFASAIGGKNFNTFSEIGRRNRYVNPSLALPSTYTLVDATAGLNFGLFKGLSFSPFVGFAVVRDAMVPYGMTVTGSVYNGTAPEFLNEPVMTAVAQYPGKNMNGFKAGLDVAYDYADLVHVKAKYMFTPQGDDYGYVDGDDRAEHRLSAELKVSPVKRLDVSLGYELRSGRTFLYEMVSNTGLSSAAFVKGHESVSLENVSNLGFGAAYRINELLTVSGRADNLLNRRYQNYYGMYAQRFHFLLGASLTF